jgi:hypothetical protein
LNKSLFDCENSCINDFGKGTSRRLKRLSLRTVVIYIVVVCLKLSARLYINNIITATETRKYNPRKHRRVSFMNNQELEDRTRE